MEPTAFALYFHGDLAWEFLFSWLPYLNCGALASNRRVLLTAAKISIHVPVWWLILAASFPLTLMVTDLSMAPVHGHVILIFVSFRTISVICR